MINISTAKASDRQIIYNMRHQIYAEELGQHATNDQLTLSDSLDAFNHYLITKDSNHIKGFVSITPPQGSSYSIDKYFSRNDIPCHFNKGLYEVRLLTVPQDERGKLFATLLMYGAYRWIQFHGGTEIVAIGRREIKNLYQKIGFKFTGLKTTSGQVTYELMTLNLNEAQDHLKKHSSLLKKIKHQCEWQLDFPFEEDTTPCYHGGAFFNAIGNEFDTLENRHHVINADVLDAWFDPTPKIQALGEQHFSWLLKTSPPTHAEGLKKVLSSTRNLSPESFLLGPGSSSLMFFAFQKLLSTNSSVLLPDPTYGEYEHIIKNVVNCHLNRWSLSEEEYFYLNPKEVIQKIHHQRPNLFVLVNPNNPTGQYLTRNEILEILQSIPKSTFLWVDEAYIDYLDTDQSVERDVVNHPNLIVSKSMSKVYALSGTRVAYLCAHPSNIKAWSTLIPPWSIGSLAQMAAIQALQDPHYYQKCYLETKALRHQFTTDLKATFPSWKIYPGCANFVLCKLPETSPSANSIIQNCQKDGIYLRDAGKTSPSLGHRHLRIAIKNYDDQEKILSSLKKVCPYH